jgi:hypothetical protein
LPVSWISVPPAPEPLPRRTTPLALIVCVVALWNLPGPRRTAPRKPLASGRRETSSMAPWMAAVSSPPDGMSVAFTGTSGMATPPP